MRRFLRRVLSGVFSAIGEPDDERAGTVTVKVRLKDGKEVSVQLEKAWLAPLLSRLSVSVGDVVDIHITNND